MEYESKCFSPQLVLSSTFFLTNAVVNYFREFYIYSFLFFMLSITSIYHHWNNTDTSKIIDKLFVFLVVLYGAYIFVQNEQHIFSRIIVILLFMSTLFLYYYGYTQNKYCFDPDLHISQNYHSAMHLFSSLGHHIIVACI